MQSKIRNRVIVILIVTIAGFAVVFKPHHKPTLRDFTNWSQIKTNLSENIHLGLDLRGGSHLVMQVQTDEVIQKITRQNGDIAREREDDFGRDWKVDERGGAVTASMDETAQNQFRDKATEQAKAIIENRVNAFGVTEPTIQRQGGEGTYQIVIQMPGVDDPERVKNTLNADSNLELRLVAKGTQIPYPTSLNSRFESAL